MNLKSSLNKAMEKEEPFLRGVASDEETRDEAEVEVDPSESLSQSASLTAATAALRSLNRTALNHASFLPNSLANVFFVLDK
jgi:hypothetical protein